MTYQLVADVHLGPSRAGLTLTAEYRNSDHTVNGGGSAVITDAGSGDYDCLLTVPVAFQGWFRLKNGATVLGSWALDPREVENADVKTSTVSGGAGGDPWPTVLPNDGLYPSGTAGYILGHRLDVPVSSRAPLGTVAVDVVSAGTVGGLLQLTIGATYAAAHGTALTHTLTSTDPDLAGATVTLEVGPHGGTPYLTAAVVVSGPTSAQVLTTELTSAVTGACPESRTAQWAYWADWGGTPAARVVLRGGPAFLVVAP